MESYIGCMTIPDYSKKTHDLWRELTVAGYDASLDNYDHVTVHYQGREIALVYDKEWNRWQITERGLTEAGIFDMIGRICGDTT
jgi:hypothetical protein